VLRYLKAFSLIELMICIVLIIILSSIGYPLYRHPIIKAKREAAKTALLNLAIALEDYRLRQGSYAGAVLAELTSLMSIQAPDYQLQLQSASTSYYLEAIPLGKQTQDSECMNLGLDHLGTRSRSGSAPLLQCW
jgi:type IV pilus assembly protein PilE